MEVGVGGDFINRSTCAFGGVAKGIGKLGCEREKEPQTKGGGGDRDNVNGDGIYNIYVGGATSCESGSVARRGGETDRWGAADWQVPVNRGLRV